MDKDKLSQLKYLSKEIELIEEQIKSIDYTMATDSVKGSDPYFPYTYHSITIKGVDIEDYNNKVKRLENKLYKKKHELIDLVNEIIDYIDDVEDSEIRQILTLRYIKGYTWEQVAIHMGSAGDGSTERKKHDRFLKYSRVS